MTRTSSVFLSTFSILLALLVSVSLFSIRAMPASAHTLAVEGEVGVTMHIDPADEPIAGSPSTIYLDFKNSTREFDPTEYNFILAITEGSSTLATTTLFGNGETGATASYTYTFAQPGEYGITVTATPKDGDEPSIFTFDIHATPAEPQTNSVSAFLGVHGGHALVVLLLVAILIVVMGWEKWKEHKIKGPRV